MREPPDPSVVRRHLTRIVDSPVFVRAPRMQKFLSYIVRETLAGRADKLKEYAIGVSVFGRTPDFEPGTNPIVRVEAGRLRRLLAQYDAEYGQMDELSIAVPKGSYVPEFRLSVAQRSVEEAGVVPVAAKGRETAPSVSDAQCRQVTILSCTIECAGTHERDPEAYRDGFRLFHDTVRKVAGQYGGTVDAHASDRLLVYFGWPTAFEDSAGRALNAAIELASIYRERQGRFGLRAGVVTGHVITDDEPEANALALPTVIGEAPALAARIMRQATLNDVIVAESTRRIVCPSFEFARSGALDSQGADGVPTWRLIGIRTQTSRFRAAARGMEMPIVGRREELALLLKRWHAALGKEGHAIAVIGEAGIGKSKLVHTLIDRTENTSLSFVFQCYPYHSDSPLYPVAACIRDNQNNIDKFIDLNEKNELIRYFDGTDDGRCKDLSPIRRRELVFGILVKIFVHISENFPLVLLFEDIQWSDPTTIEFLRYLRTACRTERILVILSSRTIHSIAALPDLTVLTLSRLGQSPSLSIIDRLAGTTRLPTATRNLIVEKADGIPLYVEELTKSFLVTETARSDAVPETLLDLLTAQMDRLGPARAVAQVAAVIGRAFSREQLSRVMSEPAEAIDQIIDQLIAADVIVSRGYGVGQYLAFRHALLRDAAYESMLSTCRQNWHARIAKVFERAYPDLAAAQPELVARHWTDAGMPDCAIPLWLDAGRKAASRFANTEALSHLRTGMVLLDDLPETIERHRLELELLTELALVLRVSRGYGHAELWDIYGRASKLCAELGDNEAYAKNVFGLWTFAAAHADWKTTDELAAKYAALAETLNDDQLQVECWRLRGASAVYQGRFAEAYAALRKTLDLYDPTRHHARLGYDPGPTALAYLAWASLYVGRPDESISFALRALSWANAKRHAPTIALVLAWTMLPMTSREDFGGIIQNNERLAELCDENGFPHWKAFGAACSAWARFRQTEDPEFIPPILAAAEEFRIYWGPYLSPFFWLLAADACRRAGQVEKGLGLVASALEFQKQHGEYLWEPEAHRTAALLYLSQRPPQTGPAKRHLNQAIDASRARQAVFFEKQAASFLSLLSSKEEAAP